MNPEQSRRSNQCEEMLRRLQLGKVSNGELAQIALKYTSRISDLRKAGWDIECISHNRATGETWYELRKPLGQLQAQESQERSKEFAHA